MCQYGRSDDSRLYLVPGDKELPDGDRQAEAARAGAAGVDEQHAVASFDLGLVRMPEHHHPESRRPRVNIQLQFIMPEIDRYRAELHHILQRDGIRPRPPVVVPPNDRDRGELAQLHQDFRLIDIARMEDVVAALQCSNGFFPHESVRVGYQPDAKRWGRNCHGLTTELNGRPR